MLNDASYAFAAEDGSGLREAGKTQFPVYPDEKPSKAQLRTWCDMWDEDITGQGYSTLVRGEEPFELMSLRWLPGACEWRHPAT